MRQSRYNIFFKSEDRQFIFNSKSLSIIEIDADNLNQMENYTDRSQEELIENGFLIEDETNEVLELKK